MAQSAILAGTGYENRDGTDRAEIIRRHCRDGKNVFLVREPNNPHDPHAVAVYIETGRLFWRTTKQIGYIKAGTAEWLAKKLDSGQSAKAWVKSLYAPEEREHPRVTIEFEI